MLPSGAQILARPSADADSREGGDSIQEMLETVAACAAHAKVKVDEGTAKLYVPEAVEGRPALVSLCVHELTKETMEWSGLNRS